MSERGPLWNQVINGMYGEEGGGGVLEKGGRGMMLGFGK